MCVYVALCAREHVCTHVHMRTPMRMRGRMCAYARVNASAYVHTHTRVPVYTYMCVHVRERGRECLCACQAASQQALGSNKGGALSGPKPGPAYFSRSPAPFCVQHRPLECGHPRVQLVSMEVLWDSSVWTCTRALRPPGPLAEGEGIDVGARGGACVLLPPRAVPPICARTVTPESSGTLTGVFSEGFAACLVSPWL